MGTGKGACASIHSHRMSCGYHSYRMSCGLPALQVHEKSILLPLLPITMLAADLPALALWTPLVASFSMFPLLVRDGAALPYTACCAMYVSLMLPLYLPTKQGSGRGSVWWIERSAARLQPYLVLLAATFAMVLHCLAAAVPPPTRYPWLYDRAFISLSFAYFCVVAVYLQLKQWALPGEGRQQQQQQRAEGRQGRKHKQG